MRNIVVYYIISCCLFCSGIALAQETPALSMDEQFAVLGEEIEAWKKEMTKNIASRASVETLLRQGVAFQKSYKAETDSIVKGDLLDEYVKQRDAALKKLPVTVFMSYGLDASYSYPYVVVFEKDDLEIDAKRPFLLQPKAGSSGLATAQAKRRMLFSHKESQRFANLLSRLIAKAQAKDAMSVSMRDLVASTQIVNTEGAIYLQFKTPAGTVGQEMYRLTEFDAKLLVDRITAVLKASPPPAGYAEPDDLDPATALFSGPVEAAATKTAATPAAADSANISARALSFDVTRIKVTQGQQYGYYTNQRVRQQFDYRVLFRWGGTQPLNVQVIMYLVATVNNKVSIVGRDVKEMTVETGRNQELLISAEQVIPGPTANAVIVQCFSGGRLLKSYSSSAQYKKYADMAEIESQLQPLYQNPQYIYPVTR